MSGAEAGEGTVACAKRHCVSQLDACTLHRFKCLAPSLSCCVALSKVLNLSVPQLPHLSPEVKKTTCLIGLLRTLNEIILTRHAALCPPIISTQHRWVIAAAVRVVALLKLSVMGKA